MADTPQKVTVQAERIDATFLPSGFSIPYRLYVIQQTTDIKNIADASNNANDLAYQATIKNEEQDVTLANHEGRIAANTNAIGLLEVRITTAEGKIVVLRGDVDYLLGEVIDIQADIVTLQGDYLSKTATTNQMVQPVSGSFLIGNIPTPTTDKLQVLGSENVSVSYKVAGIQVVGARNTGWTASTGAASKAGINGSVAYTVGSSYSQSEVQAIATGLQQVRHLVVALQNALGATAGHGLIDS